MKELTTGWKIFRVACILHMIAVGLQLIFYIGVLFNNWHHFYPWFSTVVYGFIFIFVYQALSLLNYNYPDTPLSPAQKRGFNWLYFVNFISITFLFADVIRESRSTLPFLTNEDGLSLLSYLLIGFSLIHALVIFILHIVFLGGMFNLRRLIYKNSVENWQQQFSDDAEDKN